MVEVSARLGFLIEKLIGSCKTALASSVLGFSLGFGKVELEFVISVYCGVLCGFFCCSYILFNDFSVCCDVDNYQNPHFPFFIILLGKIQHLGLVTKIEPVM